MENNISLNLGVNGISNVNDGVNSGVGVNHNDSNVGVNNSNSVTSINTNDSGNRDLTIIDYKEFESICNKDCPLEVYSNFRPVVNFFINNRKQTNGYMIDVKDYFVNDDLLSCFSGFQILQIGSFKKVDKFIIFVDPNDLEDSYLSEIDQNLNSSIKPTHICILSNDIDVINNSFEYLLNINPHLRLVNVTNKFDVSSLMNNRVLARLKSQPLFPIVEYCRELSYILNDLNDYQFYKRFDEIVEEILEKSKSKIVIFGGEYSTKEESIYKLIVIECCLRNFNFKFYIEDENVNDIAIKVSSCLFDPNNQLVEDVVSFIENFPGICLELKGRFTVTNFVTDKSLKLKLKYVPLHNLDKKEVKFNKIESNGIKIIPLSTYYNLESDDLQFNISEEKRLREFIKSLYDVFDLNTGIIDITNLAFFSLDGVDYVGYNVGYDVFLDCKSVMPGLFLTDRVIKDFEALNKFIYLPMFLNRERFIRNISNKLGSSNITSTYARVKNNVRKNTSIFRYTSTVFTEELLEFPNILFLAGLSSKESRIFKENACKGLVNILGLDSVREEVDSFGCFNKISNPNLKI